MKRPHFSLRTCLFFRVLLILLILSMLWLVLGRPAFSAEQAVRWHASSSGWKDDYQIYVLERTSNNSQGIPGPIYTALSRCGEEYYEISLKRIWGFLWQPFSSQFPFFPTEDESTPLLMYDSRWGFGSHLGRWVFDSREPDLFNGTEEYEENRFFYANAPTIARVTFTVGDTTKDAVRPEADRPFWYLIEAFPYRRTDTGYQYRGYAADGTLIFDSGLCPFD